MRLEHRVQLMCLESIEKGIINSAHDLSDGGLAVNIAESIVCSKLTDGIFDLSVVEDFQIVNGGQTTASLYHTMKKDRADLSEISVQMKLMVIHENEDDNRS